MSNKPKTFEEFRKKEIDERMKRDAVLIIGAEAAWNARDELAKDEIEAARQEMQAEIDKRDAVIKSCTSVLETLLELGFNENFIRNELKLIEKELNGVKDE